MIAFERDCRDTLRWIDTKLPTGNILSPFQERVVSDGPHEQYSSSPKVICQKHRSSP